MTRIIVAVFACAVLAACNSNTPTQAPADPPATDAAAPSAAPEGATKLPGHNDKRRGAIGKCTKPDTPCCCTGGPYGECTTEKACTERPGYKCVESAAGCS